MGLKLRGNERLVVSQDEVPEKSHRSIPSSLRGLYIRVAKLGVASFVLTGV